MIFIFVGFRFVLKISMLEARKLCVFACNLWFSEQTQNYISSISFEIASYFSVIPKR